MDNAKQAWGQERIERFEYPAMPFTHLASSLFGLTDVQSENGGQATESGSPSPGSTAGTERPIEEVRRAFAAGHERGLLDGRQIERDANASATKTAKEQAIHQAAILISQFAQERDEYIAAIEKEVVKLALAVAARILRRESQMDPLLLTGAVRVALGQLSGSTEVRLRVPETELDLWKDVLALLPNLAIKPQVLAGEGMRLGDCVIETALGSVDLGIRSQLGEIERGFFDSAAKNKEPAITGARAAAVTEGGA